MKRYDINILELEDIPNILKYYDISASIYKNIPTSFNMYNASTIHWYLKNPPSGLLGVYFKARFNPFNVKYPVGDNEYTLEEILQYEIAIEEAFIFWDAKQKPQEEKVKIEVIVANIFVDQSKEEVINNYLIEKNIIKKPKLIKLGCYNITPNTGLIAPLPQETFHDLPIDAIYFDDGIRIINETTEKQSLKKKIKKLQTFRQITKNQLNDYESDSSKEFLESLIDRIEEDIGAEKQELSKLPGNIEDLLKLSNGAKNIYLFHFNVQKRKKIIELSDSLDPYQAIRDWKRENNLYTFPPLIQESTYDEKIKELAISFEITSPSYKQFNIPFKAKIISHIVETDNTIYLILCNDSSFKIKLAEEYRTNYINWLNQCYIKYGHYYSGDEVRDKFGHSSRTIYDENGNTHYYRYEGRLFFDNWYIDGNTCARRYYLFLDTGPPPKKPDILDS